MPNLYSYEGVDNLEPLQLFFWVATDKIMEQLGVQDVGAAMAIVAGLPIVPTRGKFGGAIRGTSVASITARRFLDYDLPRRVLPTVTFGINNQGRAFLRTMLHRNIGAFVGRAVPVVGWLIVAWDVGNIVFNTITTYNSIVRREDRIF